MVVVMVVVVAVVVPLVVVCGVVARAPVILHSVAMIFTGWNPQLVSWGEFE